MRAFSETPFPFCASRPYGEGLAEFRAAGTRKIGLGRPVLRLSPFQVATYTKWTSPLTARSPCLSIRVVHRTVSPWPGSHGSAARCPPCPHPCRNSLPSLNRPNWPTRCTWSCSGSSTAFPARTWRRTFRRSGGSSRLANRHVPLGGGRRRVQIRVLRQTQRKRQDVVGVLF